MNYFSTIIFLLRDRQDFLEEIHQGVRLKSKISSLMISSFCFFALYGAIIGSFDGWAQALSSAIKLPALYLITLVVCLPTLYIFNVLFGSKQNIAQHFTYLLSAVSVIAILLCGFAPVTLFFLITINNSFKDYYFFMLLNVSIFALTGIIGVSFLYQIMRPIADPNDESVQAEKATALPAKAPDLTDFKPDFQVEASGKPEKSEFKNNLQVRTNILRFWLVLYGFVGSQLGWVLRPFFGSPGDGFALFRAKGGNIITGVWTAFTNLLN
jgi:hypothetical protein